MFDNISNEQIRKAKGIIGYIGRFFGKYGILNLFSVYVFWLPIIYTFDPFYGFQVIKGYVVIGVILTVMMFYSLTRLINVYNEEIALRFINSEIPLDSFKKRLKFLFSQKENKIELAVVFLGYLILPSKFTNPCFVWLFVADDGSFPAKLKLLLILLPIMLFIYILANMSAMKYWDKKERIRLASLECKSESEKASDIKKDRKEFRKLYSMLIIGYFAGCFVFMFALITVLGSILGFVISVLLTPSLWAITAIILFAPFCFRSVRALKRRRKFLKELKKLCKEKGYSLSKVKYPYKSLFSLYKGESFIIQTKTTEYSCKLISTKKYNSPLHIQPKGKASYLIKIMFLKIELFSYSKNFDFGWESDCKKIVILNPTPKKVYTCHGGKSVEIDNGDIIDGYELYATTAFLNALSRDVINID